MKGISKTRPYRILAGMKQRCANPANIHYANYGGRGITVCNEWLGRDGAETFYEWAVAHGYRDDLTIDRIDNDFGYSPSNCAWIPQTVNNSSNNLRVKLWYIIRCVPQFEADYLLPLIAKVENETDRNFLMKEFCSAQKSKSRRHPKVQKKPGRITCIRAGDGGLLLARLAHGLGDMTHLFDPALDVGFSHNEVIEITVQCLTDKVEIIQIHTLRKIMVQLVDSLTANPCYASEFALCHPPFAKAGRQQNPNHSLWSPLLLILADLWSACLHFGKKPSISASFSEIRKILTQKRKMPAQSKMESAGIFCLCDLA